MKWRLILLCYTICIFNINLYGYEDSLRIDNIDNKYSALNAESWIAGQAIGSNQLATFFNITNSEFDEYVDQYEINTLRAIYYYRSDNGSVLEEVDNVLIDLLSSDFSAENWVHTIDPAYLENGEYLVNFYINEESCGPQVLIPVTVDFYEGPDADLPIELPEFNCGDEYIEEDITDETPLPTASVGDIFTINGFPILLETVSGGNGTFSGSGLVPLPFKNGIVRVEFDEVTVTIAGIIINGEVTAIPGDLRDCDELNVDEGVIQIGKDICLAPEDVVDNENGEYDPDTGLDEWGFDSTGVHSVTDSLYDTNGFDQSGKHKNGSFYDDCGCSREGWTNETPRQQCTPGCVLNEANSSFADSMEVTLPGLIDSLISVLTNAYDDSLNTINCDQYRMTMDPLIQTMGISPDIVKGTNNQFYNPGMHLNFKSQPLYADISTDRDPNATDLEKAHVDLHRCDRTDYALRRFKVVLEDELDREALKELILERIRGWSSYELEIYSNDTQAYNKWVLDIILEEMTRLSGLGAEYFALQSFKQPQLLDVQKSFQNIFDINPNDYYHQVAELNADIYSAYDYSRAEREEIAFAFEQGDRYIKGVHRAFYLEILAENLSPIQSGSSTLPVKVTNQVGNKEYTIMLDNIVFTPGGARTDACIVISNPESGERIVFEGTSIGFGPTGLEENSSLSLATEVQVRLNNAAMLVLKASDSTYVAWNCEGFESLGIDAQVEFCRNFITPLDSITLEPLPDPEQRYRLDILLQNVSGWLEFVLEVNASPFALTSYPNISWTLESMLLDFNSDTTPQFKPIEGYDSPYLNDDNGFLTPNWRGFYLKRLEATFPNEFSSNGGTLSAGAIDVLIDGTGFSGGVYVGVNNEDNPQELLSFEEGNLDGWGFSIEEYRLLILQNQFAGAGLAGEINVPIFEERLDYQATVQPDQLYQFVVTPKDTMTSNLFLAEATIDPSSTITVTLDDGNFEAVANLTGTLAVKAGADVTGSAEINLPTASFQNFKVMNHHPYFESGTWGVENASQNSKNFAGFQLRMRDPRICKGSTTGAEPEMGLGLSVEIGLASEKVKVHAAGSLCIMGKMVTQNDRQKWIYQNLDLDKFSIGGSIPGIADLSGGLEWFDEDEEPDFGNGFRGYLDLEFDKFDGVGLTAVGQFGRITTGPGPDDSYKYFYVDAVAKLGAASPSIGVLSLRGFGGGVSENMSLERNDVLMFKDLDAGLDDFPPIGESLSQTVYVPDESVGMSYKANILIATFNETMFNGTVAIAAEFNDNYGINKFILEGSGQFMADIDVDILPEFVDSLAAVAPPASVDAAMAAFVFIEYNFKESSFHGNLDVFLNAQGILTGAGTGGRLINAEIHFDPRKWYIYVGTPDSPCGAKFTIPGIGDGLGITATAYFDMGSIVPSMPDVPAEARQIAYTYSKNESLRIPGAGLVFGAALKLELSVGAPGLAEVEAKAGVGFDVILRKYEDLRCSGSDDVVGIDGWYAIGQMWAYVIAKLKVFGVNLASAGIAAILEARMPNPFYAEGSVGIEAKLLFITIRKSLTLRLGENCVLESDNPDDQLGIQVISHLTPLDSSRNIPLISDFKAVFNVRPNDEYKIKNKYYFVDQPRYFLTNQYGTNIDIQAALDGNRLILTPRDFLNANDTITFRVEVDVFDGAGNLITTQHKEAVVTSGKEIDHIPEYNIRRMYPTAGMSNYYKDMTRISQANGNPMGYITLYNAQAGLLADLSYDESLLVRLTKSGGNPLDIPVEYDVFEKTLRYELNPAWLENEAFYKIEVIKKSGLVNEDNVENQPSLGTIPSTGDNKYHDATSNNERILLTFHFRTSQYNTLGDKLDVIFPNYDQVGLTSADITQEFFDVIELTGDERLPSLLSIDSRYFENLGTGFTEEDEFPAHVQDNDLFDYAYFTGYIKLEDAIRYKDGNQSWATPVFISSDPINDIYIDKEQYDQGGINSTVTLQHLQADFLDGQRSIVETFAEIILQEMQAKFARNPSNYTGMMLSYEEILNILQEMRPDLYPDEGLVGGGRRKTNDIRPQIVITYGPEGQALYIRNFHYQF